MRGLRCRVVTVVGVLLGVAALSTTGAPVRARASASPVVHVLFIGNSYTYFNNLGDILSAVAAGVPRVPRIESVLAVRGGATLGSHLEQGAAVGLLASRRWDYVVLQEQSLLGGGTVDGRPVVGDPTVFHAAVRKWVQRIRAAGAKPVLYMTWARRDPIARPDEMQRQLADAYTSIGRELGVRVAPVGLAWAEVRRQHPEVALHADDGAHPTPAGSYLAACVLLTTLTGASPVGAPAKVQGHAVIDGDDATLVDSSQVVTLAELDRRTAAALQDAAWRVAGSGGR